MVSMVARWQKLFFALSIGQEFMQENTCARSGT